MTHTTQGPARTSGDIRVLARRLAGPAVAGGLAGGLFMIVVMILVTGTGGMGYASPLNLGMPAFVYTITPPLTTLPTLMPAIGVHLPASVMAQLGPAIHSGHIPAAMMPQLAHQLSGMGVPAGKVAMIGQLMSGQADNSTVTTLLSQMPRPARSMAMAAMPGDAGRVVVGTILHFAFAGFLGVLFAVLIAGAAWLAVPAMRTTGGVIAASVAGGAIVYVINRWALLPPMNPMMSLVPQLAFFLTHLLFGLVVGIMLAAALHRPALRAALPAR